MRFWRGARILPVFVLLILQVSIPGPVGRATSANAVQTTGNDWPMDGGNAARTGAVTGSGPVSDPRLLWAYGESLFSDPLAIDGMVVIGGAGGLLSVDGEDGGERWRFPTTALITAMPATDGTTIYAGDQSGLLVALHPTTGDERWRFDAGGVITETIWSHDLVLLGLEGGDVIAVEAADGGERWRYATGAERVKPSLVSDGVVYVAGWNATLFALDAATGQERWRTQTGASPLRVAPLVAGDLVFAGGEDEVLVGIDPTTGEVREREKVDGWILSLATIEDTLYVGTNENALLALHLPNLSERWHFDAGGTVWSIVPAGEALYVSSTDGHLYAVDPERGVASWQFQTGDELETAAAIGGGRIFVGGSRAGTLVALDRTSGGEVWRLTGAPFSSPLVVAQGFIYLVADDDKLYALAAASGDIQWRYDTGDSALFQGPAVAGGVVYLPSDEQGLVALDAQTGERYWRAETPADYLSSPAVLDGVVYVAGDYAGDLSAHDAATGDLLWSAPDDQAQPAIAGGKVFTKWAEFIFAHDAATGEQLWRVGPNQETFSTNVMAAGNLVYAGDQFGAVHALDAATGETRWTLNTGVWIEEIATAAGLVYAITWDGDLIAIDAATGDEQWRFAGPQRFTSMAIAGGILYAGGVDGDVTAIDAATGAERWRLVVRAGTPISSVAVANTIVYAAGEGTLFAIGGRQAPPPVRPAASPPPSATPAAVACAVEPRTVAGIEAITASYAGSIATPLGEITPVAASALPAGEPLDDETLAAIRQTLDELVACGYAGDILRAFALFSDDFVASHPEDFANLVVDDVPDFEPLPEGYLFVSEIADAVQQADGRVVADAASGSIFVAFGWDSVSPADLATMPPLRFVFVEERGRWVIDDVAPVEVDDL